MSIIQQKINEGTLKGYFDYRSGTFHDWSGNGNVLTPRSGLQFPRFQNGGILCTGYENATALDTGLCGLTDYPFTLVSLHKHSPFSFNVGGVMIGICDSDSPSGALSLAFNTSQQVVFGGTSVVDDGNKLAFAAGRATSADLRQTISNNIGQYSTTANFPFNEDWDRLSIGVSPDSTPGNWWRGWLYATLVFSEAVSNEELAILKGELLDTKWTTKAWDKTNGTDDKDVQYKTDWGSYVSNNISTALAPIGDSGFKRWGGAWKISTDTINGSLCKVIECVSGGEANINLTPYMTEANMLLGALEFYFNFPTGAATFIGFGVDNGLDDGNAAYTIGTNIEGTTDQVAMFDPGYNPLTTPADCAPSVWHKAKITMAADRTKELFIDDVSLGSVVDTDVTEAKFFGILSDTAGLKVALSDRAGNYAITKYYGG